MVDDEELPDVLRRQWARIAAGSAQTELTAPSRVRGWRNAEVMAHLAVQPVLLGRFLADAGTTRARTGLMRLEDNLAGTRALADTIDAAAKRGARAGQVDFARQAAGVDAALAALSAADVTATVVTVQGPIRLADYLRTRCVEAVVHGMDLQPPIAPDSAALAVAVDALMALLRARAPAGLAAARDLPAKEFLDVATGRASAPVALADVMPLMG